MKLFSIDFRSLALFRFGLGLVLVCYAYSQFTIVDIYHLSGGITSEETLRNYYAHGWTWSLNWLSNSAPYQYSLILILAIAAVSLAVGWCTRFVTVLSWLLVSSLNADMPLGLSGGDILLSLLLFWSIFLPLGSHWSFDVKRYHSPSVSSFASVATAALLLQMGIMYFFSGVSKCNESWLSGTALDVIFANPKFVRPLGHVLAGYPWLTSAVTWGTIFLELFIPFLLFSPWRPTLCRSLALFILIPFHVGIELSMHVILLSLVSIVGLIPFIPELWWQHLPLRQLETVLENRNRVSITSSESNKQHRRRDRRANRQFARADFLSSRLMKGFVLACILYAFIYSALMGFASPDLRKKLGSYQRCGELLVLKQNWNMFSVPTVMCHDFACVARLRNDVQIDLLRNESHVDDRSSRPRFPVEHQSARLLAVSTRLSDPSNESFRKDFVEYLCRSYQESQMETDSDVLECFLMYYLFGAHPNAGKASFVELFHLDLRAKGKYVAGRRHGPWVLSRDNGRKMAEGSYHAGLPTGKWIFWDELGIMRAEGRMERGKQVGKWTYPKKDKQQADP